MTKSFVKPSISQKSEEAAGFHADSLLTVWSKTCPLWLLQRCTYSRPIVLSSSRFQSKPHSLGSLSWPFWSRHNDIVEIWWQSSRYGFMSRRCGQLCVGVSQEISNVRAPQRRLDVHVPDAAYYCLRFRWQTHTPRHKFIAIWLRVDVTRNP